MLQLQFAQHYLDAAVQVLELNEAGIPVKISAVKAVHKYVRKMLRFILMMMTSLAFVKEVMIRLLFLSPLV
jgi:hypothetical protein